MKKLFQVLPILLYCQPAFKDTVRFLQRAKETGGEYSECEVTLIPDGKNILRIHKKYTETLIAFQGVGMKAGGMTIILRPGEKFTVPIGVVHHLITLSPRQSGIKLS